jgi:hypothetical protein
MRCSLLFSWTSAYRGDFLKRRLLDQFARPLLHGKVVSVLELHNLDHGFESSPSHGASLRVGGRGGPMVISSLYVFPNWVLQFWVSNLDLNPSYKCDECSSCGVFNLGSPVGGSGNPPWPPRFFFAPLRSILIKLKRETIQSIIKNLAAISHTSSLSFIGCAYQN